MIVARSGRKLDIIIDKTLLIVGDGQLRSLCLFAVGITVGHPIFWVIDLWICVKLRGSAVRSPGLGSIGISGYLELFR